MSKERSLKNVGSLASLASLVQSERFDPKKNLVGQFTDNLTSIYAEQEVRDAKDDDSNFSNESFQRKKRATMSKKKKEKKGEVIKLRPTPMGE